MDSKMWLISLKRIKAGVTKEVDWLSGHTEQDLKWALKKIVCTYKKTSTKLEDFTIRKYELVSEEIFDDYGNTVKKKK